jgi:hypothetical protein
MTEIFVDPSKTNISFDVVPQSLHVIGFEVVVIDTDQNTVLERYDGQTSKGGVNTVLTNPSAYYKGKYISGVFDVESPDGTDYPYQFTFSIALTGIDISPNITLTGTTTDGGDNCISTFHLN